MTSHSALYSKTRSQITRRPWIARLQARVIDPLHYWLSRLLLTSLHFHIDTHSYHYFVDWYNYTFTNERAIELPFFIDLISHSNHRHTLEIGNTLSHYIPISHRVVDKYESGKGVKNIDVLDYFPQRRFECIFAVSTIEHIGWHESEQRAAKAIEAIRHLRKLLSTTGRLTISFPIGVNPALDAALRNRSLQADKVIFLRRKNWFNLWEVSSYKHIRKLKYNHPYPNANAICIAHFGPIARRKAKPHGLAHEKMNSSPMLDLDALSSLAPDRRERVGAPRQEIAGHEG